MSLPSSQARDLRDRFAVALAGGYEAWRWSRSRDAKGVPNDAANEDVARAIWAQADILVLLRDADTGPIPCPECGWHTADFGARKVACLRCKKVHPVPPNRQKTR